jgi:glycosyltransferase involved in cell wall biosynthesis
LVILISSYTLDLSGVPTYTLTLYNELKKRGHNIQVYSPLSGVLEKKMNVCSDLDALDKPDIIIAQHNLCAIGLKNKFPDIPMIYSIHHHEYPEEKPPTFECEWYTAINEKNVETLVANGVSSNKITIVRDFIDIERFYPTVPVNDTLKNVLYISNRKKWKTHNIVEQACKELKLNFKAVGSPYGRAHAIEENINKADLVIGWARCLMEAMSCGRPVISYDKEYGDGYLDYDTYLKSRAYNFGPGGINKYTVEGLIKEINRYDPKDGDINRHIILKEHNVVYGVDKIMGIIGGLLDGCS